MKHFRRHTSDRRGVVLIVILVLVVMIALAGFGFVVEMTTEYEATKINGDLLQAQQVMASAECYVLTQAQRMKQSPSSSDLFGATDRTGVFQAVTLRSFDTASSDVQGRLSDSAWRFAVVKDLAFFDAQQRQSQIQSAEGMLEQLDGFRELDSPEFGLRNESSKLNLGRVLYWDTVEPGRGRRALMNIPGMTNEAADSILDWLDEDDTPRQFGAEADYYRQQQLNVQPRNGMPETLTELLLVRGVNRAAYFGSGSLVASEATPGWEGFLTLTSAESTDSNPPKLAVNELTRADLSTFEQELAQSVSEDVARYVVLSLMFGVTTSAEPANAVSPLTVDLTTLTIDSVSGSLQLPDLIDSVVSLTDANGELFVASPLNSEDPADLQTFARLEQLLTTDDTLLAVIRGRINLLEASEEVLRALTDDPATASQIVQQRESLSDDERKSSVWLLSRRVLDVTEYRNLYADITTRGDVYSGEIIVYRAVGGPFLRRKITIDAANGSATRVNWQDRSSIPSPVTLRQLEPSTESMLR